jgi:hypothetical protein
MIQAGCIAEAFKEQNVFHRVNKLEPPADAIAQRALLSE